MAVGQLAADHYAEQVAVADQAATAAGELWADVEPARIAASWLERIPVLARLLGLAQTRAAVAADGYVTAVASESGVRAPAAGRVSAAALTGIASDGRPLDSLLYQPVIRALALIGDGAPVARALLVGRLDLDMIVRTQVADAGRVADGIAVTARPVLTGYVRMLSPPSCDRCVILAGRRYRWNAGFRRHPRCDCRHIPAAENTSDDLRTRPRAYFDSLSESEQDRVFTRAGAQAIRDGADIRAVVNVRRGAAGLATASGRITAEEARALRSGRARGVLERTDVYGRALYVTTEGTTVRGLAGVRLGAREGTKQGGRYRQATAPRLMPESIYEIAGDDREEAIRLLRRHGYII